MRPTIPKDNNGVRLIPNIPPEAIPDLEGKSQDKITITLTLSSPRRSFFSSVPFIRGLSSPELFGDLPVSTALARQTIRAGRPRIRTEKI